MIGSESSPLRLRPLLAWHTVLAVDDDPLTLSSIRRELNGEPYDVITTEQPTIALKWLDRREISLAISDQRMPEMEGDLFLEEVWKKSPMTARLLLTGYPESVRAIPPSRRCLLKILTKPWDEWQLKATIRELLFEQETPEGGEPRE
ncbi:MAG TPA: response regulator [Planctomycetota bacterium]|nr:response regulator [Planctomycetota bacterium]